LCSAKTKKAKSFSDRIFNLFEVLPDEDLPPGTDRVALDEFIIRLGDIIKEAQLTFDRNNLLSAFEEAYQMLPELAKTAEHKKIFWLIFCRTADNLRGW